MPRKLPQMDEKEVQKMIDRTRHLGNSLGDLILFTAQDVEITPEDLKGHLKTRIGNEAWLPVDIKKKTAARKAITRIRSDLEGGALKVIVRPVPTHNDNEVRYAIVGETSDRNRAELDYNTMNQVVLDKAQGALSFTGQDMPEIRRLFDKYCSVYTSQEVLHMTKNIMSKHYAIRLNDGTGMFFMPGSVRSVTDGLMALFNIDLSSGIYAGGPQHKVIFRPIGVLNDAESRESMGNIFKSDISFDLAQAKEQLEKAMSHDKPHGLTIKSAVERYRLAKSKAEMYQILLQTNLQEIITEIDEAKKKADALLLGDDGDDDRDEEGTDDA